MPLNNTIENEGVSSEKSFLNKRVSNISIILIIFGFTIRVLMLFYYYYSYMINPQRSWGDLGSYFEGNLTSPPLTVGLLIIFRLLSFGKIEIFAFWGFLWDIISCITFYLVLKSFKLQERNRIFALFLINPFFFITNSFSLDNCGYHITDAFFLFFFLMAFVFYPKNELYAKYLFYIFLTLSMCTKYYTLPALVLFFVKYLFEKNWKEMKIFLITTTPIISFLLIFPFFYFTWFFDALFNWSSVGSSIPLYIRIIPFTIIFILFTFLRLKDADSLEISIISIIMTGSFMIFSFPYLRWFQASIFYGILKEKDFFRLNLNLGFIKEQITIDNNLITFILSIFATFLAYIFILYIF